MTRLLVVAAIIVGTAGAATANEPMESVDYSANRRLGAAFVITQSVFQAGALSMSVAAFFVQDRGFHDARVGFQAMSLAMTPMTVAGYALLLGDGTDRRTHLGLGAGLVHSGAYSILAGIVGIAATAQKFDAIDEASSAVGDHVDPDDSAFLVDMPLFFVSLITGLVCIGSGFGEVATGLESEDSPQPVVVAPWSWAGAGGVAVAGRF